MKANNDPCIGIGGAPTRCSTLPTDAKERKTYPLASGLFDYFPDALAAVAHVSFCGNEQHNPGEPLHWARGKSTDEADTMLRHFVQRGTVDTSDRFNLRHSAKMAWRCLAFLQKEIESERQSTPEERKVFAKALVDEIVSDMNAERIEHELAQRVSDAHGHSHYMPKERMGLKVEESNTPDDRYNS